MPGMGTAEGMDDAPWSSTRRDVTHALDVLAEIPPVCGPDGNDPRRPGLRQSLAWLIDDTFWGKSRRMPRDSVGTILRSEYEAECVDEVMSQVVRTSQTWGPEAPDVRWFEDSSWAFVRVAAPRAADGLRSSVPFHRFPP